MINQHRIVGSVMVALFGIAGPAAAGGNVLVIGKMRGQVEMKSVREGAKWRPAKPGQVFGTYLLRTGRGSWVHLKEQGDWRPRRMHRACLDAGSLLRVQSLGCGFQVDVVRGKVSAVDGKRGKSLFKSVGG